VSFTQYLALTAGATTLVVWHAFDTREQFYPAVVYLATSKVCVAVLANCGLAAVLLLGILLRTAFLGTVREAEVERAFDKAKDALMETCLAMTIFREEFNAAFVVGFVGLLFLKVWHWLVTDRADYLQSSPGASGGAHARVVAFMALLFTVDCATLQASAGHVLAHGPSVQLLFAFESALLASSVASAAVKYALHAVDSLSTGGWEAKGTAVFYLELVTDLFHLLVYLAFFLIVFAYYGLPLHLVRELYWTFRQFRQRVLEFVRYRRVTAHLNERFPDATPQQLAAGDATCIICREDMAPPLVQAAGPLGVAPMPAALRTGTRAKRLPCGHCFHMACLRSWLERQQTCPTCRAPVVQQAQAQAGATQPLHQPPGVVPPVEDQQRAAVPPVAPAEQHQAQAQAQVQHVHAGPAHGPPGDARAQLQGGGPLPPPPPLPGAPGAAQPQQPQHPLAALLWQPPGVWGGGGGGGEMWMPLPLPGGGAAAPFGWEQFLRQPGQAPVAAGQPAAPGGGAPSPQAHTPMRSPAESTGLPEQMAHSLAAAAAAHAAAQHQMQLQQHHHHHQIAVAAAAAAAAAAATAAAASGGSLGVSPGFGMPMHTPVTVPNSPAFDDDSDSVERQILSLRAQLDTLLVRVQSRSAQTPRSMSGSARQAEEGGASGDAPTPAADLPEDDGEATPEEMLRRRRLAHFRDGGDAPAFRFNAGM